MAASGQQQPPISGLPDPAQQQQPAQEKLDLDKNLREWRYLYEQVKQYRPGVEFPVIKYGELDLGKDIDAIKVENPDLKKIMKQKAEEMHHKIMNGVLRKNAEEAFLSDLSDFFKMLENQEREVKKEIDKLNQDLFLKEKKSKELEKKIIDDYEYGGVAELLGNEGEAKDISADERKNEEEARKEQAIAEKELRKVSADLTTANTKLTAITETKKQFDAVNKKYFEDLENKIKADYSDKKKLEWEIDVRAQQSNLLTDGFRLAESQQIPQNEGEIKTEGFGYAVRMHKELEEKLKAGHAYYVNAQCIHTQGPRKGDEILFEIETLPQGGRVFYPRYVEFPGSDFDFVHSKACDLALKMGGKDNLEVYVKNPSNITDTDQIKALYRQLEITRAREYSFKEAKITSDETAKMREKIRQKVVRDHLTTIMQKVDDEIKDSNGQIPESKREQKIQFEIDQRIKTEMQTEAKKNALKVNIDNQVGAIKIESKLDKDLYDHLVAEKAKEKGNFLPNKGKIEAIEELLLLAQPNPALVTVKANAEELKEKLKKRSDVAWMPEMKKEEKAEVNPMGIASVEGLEKLLETSIDQLKTLAENPATPPAEFKIAVDEVAKNIAVCREEKIGFKPEKIKDFGDVLDKAAMTYVERQKLADGGSDMQFVAQQLNHIINDELAELQLSAISRPRSPS